MGLVQEGFTYHIYRCPSCGRSRKEKFRLASGSELSPVTSEEMRSLGKGTLGGLVLLLGIGILGAILTKKDE
jgi:hypothetical protein